MLGLELHSKMNAIGGDAVAMMKPAWPKPKRRFAALVVSTDAADFSVGANLMLLVMEAQEGNWEEIDLMVRGFQRATMALRLSACPSWSRRRACARRGCEIVLHADRVQLAAESYLGLVEAGSA